MPSREELEQLLLEPFSETETQYQAFLYEQEKAVEAETAKAHANSMRPECMSIRMPGIPFGEQIAKAAGWWGEQITEQLAEGSASVRRLHDCMAGDVQGFVGVTNPTECQDDDKPKYKTQARKADESFMVKVPNWQDVFQFNNESVFDDRSRQQRAMDYAEVLRRSPVPPSLTEVGKILTLLDDLQDEAATLAVVLMIAEKWSGRLIPGVGWVAGAADALNAIQAFAIPASGSGMPGKAGKRRVVEKGKHTSNGYAARVEGLRNTGKLKLGIGDALQGLQATDSLFGFGVQLGPVIGFLQDAFWLGLRGGELQFQGPAWDPLGFTEAGRQACYRSPSLDLVHPQTYFVLANEALALWSNAGRVMPFIDQLGEHALASTLVGLRLSEQVLGPWLRSGVWVDPLVEAIDRVQTVRGGVREYETYNLRADQWLPRTRPATQVALRRAIGNVSDRPRQAFYESLVASTAWGFLGSLEPEAKISSGRPVGPLRDAFLLLDANLIPFQDLED